MKQTQSVAEYDAPVQQERGVCLELATPNKLEMFLTKKRENTLKRERKNEIFIIQKLDYIK